MKYFVSALIVCFLIFNATAQKISFEKGYIVNEKGDTLRGEVKFNPKKEQDCYNKVFFKDEAGIQKNYKPGKKATAYGFKDQHFIAMDFENEPKFYKILATGEINFYKMLVEEISMNQPVLGGDYFIAHKKDIKDLTAVREGKFKKQMSEWMKDNTEFISDYEDEKTFNEETATEAVKKYNAWKASQ